MQQMGTSASWEVGAAINFGEAIGVCSVPGCNGVATVESEEGIFCGRGWEEIAARGERGRADREKREACELHKLLRKEERREQFRRMGSWAAKWLWVPNLVIVGGALLYLGFVFGAMFLAWMVGQ